jgi:hypothetical protein
VERIRDKSEFIEKETEARDQPDLLEDILAKTKRIYRLKKKEGFYEKIQCRKCRLFERGVM